MDKFNLRNPAVKRILQEIKEMNEQTSCDFIAEALEGDIFEWHFVIRGPPDTEFEGGIYHGRILLPADYPFKPPSFMMLTPSGRFETNMKVCLSISSHHPEHWQPSWSVRTALMALIAFMPSPGAGALGSLDYSKEERKVLAAKARAEPPKFGSAERQQVIDDMHQRMLAMIDAQQSSSSGSRTDPGKGPCDGATAALSSAEPAAAVPAPAAGPAAAAAAAASAPTSAHAAEASTTTSLPAPVGTAPSSPLSPGVLSPALPWGVSTVPTASTTSTDSPTRPVKAPNAHPAAGHTTPQTPSRAPTLQHAATVHQQQASSEKGLTFIAIVLAIAIVAILTKKVLAAAGLDMQGLTA